jgi:hypothetical protein
MADKLYYDDEGTTFKQAFAEARKSGDKTFEWNGKSYSTALKGEKKSEHPSMKLRDIGSSPRIDDMYTARNLAAKASRDANERRDIISKQEQAKVADLTETGTGRAMMDKELPRAASRVKEARDIAKGYDKEFQARDEMARNAVSSKKRGGAIKAYASGGSVKSASSRADGIAQRGKTKGRIV